jgi:2,3,4,5-tetrahydropyridine-2-carboxylate N-succinyltransferase
LNTSKPNITIEQIEKFFSGDFSNAKEQICRKYSHAVMWYLDRGKIRVWNPNNNRVNEWIKTGILTAYKTSGNQATSAGPFQYYDKIPNKKRMTAPKVRIVPGAILRYGCFVDQDAVLLPCLINVGAYVGRGTMVDTWATVGSCAYVGSGVHVSGGVGIGGVLEPVQASPVVIEDNVFIGSRAILVEGVRVMKEAVIAAGVVLTSSTKIVDVTGNEPKIFTGVVPERAVIIPGNMQKKFTAGEFGVSCALMIGTRTVSTDKKTSLNQVLREYQLPV